jgi:hypothetical protein
MSKIITLPTEAPSDSMSDRASALPGASTALPTNGAASASVPALPPPSTDARALLELIASALAPDADEATRAGAREALVQLAQPIVTAPPAIPSAPAVQSPTVPEAALVAATPAMSVVSPPSSPIVMAARALRGLPPEQLLDIVLQRLRGALPTGATVATPKGIQFQLVPVTPPSGSR